jgi:ketosteroid isomerase-like protein
MMDRMRMGTGMLALALGLAVTGCAPAGADETSANSLAEDRMAIENTMHDYVVGLDGTELEPYLATLTDDAKFLSKEGNYEGKQAIADYVGPVMASRKQRREDGTSTDKGTHHIVTNEAITFTDADHAVMRSYWMFATAKGDGGIEISLMGSSEDHFVRQDGKWLISERSVETL